MTLVRIIKAWSCPDLMRQTPGSRGIWSDVRFTLEPVRTCDYVVVLNHAPRDTAVSVECPPENIWALMQEPPNEWFRHMHRGIDAYQRVYHQDTSLFGNKYILSQPALPWHVDRDYDFLTSAGVPPKEKDISWITSNLSVFSGHRDRLRFLEEIHGKIEFDLFGQGFTFIEDKWDALAPYRYSIAVENYQNPYYWSEKLADCFLSWTMPVYFGCSRITDYFPAESLVVIDINDPYSVDTIKEAIAGDRWRKNLDAISAARELVLNNYQFFPFITEKIRQGRCESISKPEIITLKCGYDGPPSEEEARQAVFSRLVGKLGKLFSPR